MRNSKARILIVDGDEGASSGLATLLTDAGYTVEIAATALRALALAAESPPDVVLTDVNPPGVEGLALVARLGELHRNMPVLMMAAVRDLGAAVAAMRAGAEDYIAKPVDVAALEVVLDRALARRALKHDAENLRRQLRERDEHGLHGLVGSSAAMQAVYRTVRQVARSRASVLITGESGTGKGELARAIHALSPRSARPFVSVHCASLPESLLEAELFGHERGSFTGAERRRIGRFEQADGGTLFLDEIGDIPPLSQVKLLSVLQDRAFERIGGNEPVRVDVRIIAATSRDLVGAVHEHRFREDLYYRLNVVHIEMPPLRLRGDDVTTLATYFVRKFALENRKRLDGLSDEAKAKLAAHRWPGNVRELENTIERAVALCEGARIEADDLPLDASGATSGELRVPGATMAELERDAILKTLESCDGSTSRAAELLGISVRTIQYRLHQYGMARRVRPTMPPPPNGAVTAVPPAPGSSSTSSSS